MAHRRMFWMLPALLLTAPVLGGCGLFGKSEEQSVELVKTKEAPDRPSITVGELDQLAKNYSDRLVARVSSACDRIKRETTDEDARGKAHHLKLTIALAAYDIVTTSGGSPKIPGAAQHVIDLAILTELEALHWADEKAAQKEFSGQSNILVEAFEKAREDIWQLAGRVMPAEQSDRLKTLVAQWRSKNLTVEWLARVRFDVIAQGKEAASFSEALGAAFNPIRSVLQTADEMRMVAQQALFYLRRLPDILDWTTEATVADSLAVPRISSLVQGLTESLGRVSQLALQFEHLTEPSSQEPAINSTIHEVQESLIQAKDLVREVHLLEEAVQPYLGKPKEGASSKKPTDFEAVASKVTDAADRTTSLVREARMFAESPSAVRNMDEMMARMSRDVATSGREVVDHAIGRLVQVIFLVAALVVIYKVGSFLLKRRREAKPA